MAEAIVQLLVQKLASLLEEEARLLGGIRLDAQLMRTELERMTAFLRDVDSREITDPQLKVWVSQVRSVAYDIDDVLDEFIHRLARHNDHNGLYGCLRRICCFIKKLKARHQIASQIRSLKSRVLSIAEGRQRYRLESNSTQQSSSSNVTMRTPSLPPREVDPVGIEGSKQRLATWLFDGGSRLQCISVVGMGGLGKTTLVKKVYDDPVVKKHFQSHIWVSLSQSFNGDDLLKDILQQLFHEIKQPAHGVEFMNTVGLKDIIDAFLQHRRYLLVIDDVWSVPAWEVVKDAMPDNDCGSRLMLTTRLNEVASESRIQTNGKIFKLQGLSREESWTLFCRKAFPESYICPPTLQEISQSILKKCEGLPLAIVVVGGILASKDKSNIDDWEKFHRSLPTELEINHRFERLNKILSLSYYDLPYYLKVCYLYMSLFPEDQEIENRRLIRLWIAEGFVQERGGMPVEEVGEDYLYQLRNRSLVQEATFYNDGRLKTCRIHDLMREIVILISREHGIVTLAGGSTSLWPEVVRRVAINDSIGNMQVSSNYYNRLHSILVFGSHNSLSMSALSVLLSSKFLRALDLEDSPIDVIPDAIFELVHLRYLSLRGTKVRTLPKRIVNLEKLETLDLKKTYVTRVPDEIVKLTQLRHLLVYNHVDYVPNKSLFEYVNGFKAPYNMGALVSLRELSYVEVDDQTSTSGGVVSEIGSLTQLLKLRVLKLKREDGMALCSSISKLTNLRHLSLCSIGEEEVLDLESLSPSPAMRHLRILELGGPLHKVPDWISSFHSLVNVKLLGSRLKDGNDTLNSLQNLPNLTYVTLVQAFVGDGLCFKAGGFQKLRVLFVGLLEGLKWVRVEEGSMPHLEELTITDCKLMEVVPFGLEHLMNLQELNLGGMPNKLIEALENKDKEYGHYCKIAHVSQVRLLNFVDGQWHSRSL